MYVNNRTRRKWNQVLLFLVSCHFVKYSISSPIFSSQFSQFQSARNLRNLPCVVRKSGLKGVCMFAIDCIKSNGTHLGTCIDKFYFGSCCQVKDIDSIYSPDLDDNRIDSSYPSPSSFDNKNSEKRPTTSTSSTSPPSTVNFSTSNYKTSSLKPAINYNNKTFELITTTAGTSSSTRRPATRRTTSATEKYSVSAGGFTTTLGNIVERNTSTTIKLKDERPSSTTESIKLTTFQSIGESIRNETQSSASITVQKVKPTRTTVVTKKPVPSKTSVSSTPVSSSARPTRRPGTTVKPSKNATTVIKTTRKPVASTTIAVNRRTTISRRNATLSTTRKPSTTAARPTTTEAQLTTISFVETTKAPRPKPKPTSSIVKVEPSTISDEEAQFTTTFSVVSADDKTSSSTTSAKPEVVTTTPQVSTSTVKSTIVTRRPITTQTSAASTQASTLNKKPITESTSTQQPSSTTSKDEVVTSGKLNLTTTETSTASSGLITWTLGLGNDVTDNVTKDDTWVLITSVKPDTDTQKNTSSMLETMLEEHRVTPLTQFTLTPENLTEAIIIDEKTTKIEETTLEMGLGSTETSSENSIGVSSEEISVEEIDEETTTFRMKPIEMGGESPPAEESGEEEESEEEEEETTEAITEPPTTQPFTQTTTQIASSSSELPLNETMPVSIPDETTVTPLTTDNSTYSSVDDKDHMNATTVSSVPSSSTHMSLEGVDYKQICGRRMFPEARIVGGSKAAFGRWPWQISLRQWRTSTYLHKCGSALLNENWAISAAHCVDNVPPSDLLLRLGEYDLSIEEEPYGYQERRVQIVASHPQFDPRTFEYDLALLRFYEPVIFQPNIIPVCVPENDEDFIGRTAYVTGWGRLYEDGPLPSVLQEVTVPVIKNDICEAMYRSAGYIEHIPNIFICAGWQKGGHDSCEGGPMVIQRTDKRFQLAGIISWGIGCAEPNQPGVYTRISEFRDWINQILMF